MALEGNHIRIQTRGGRSYEIYEPSDEISEGSLDTTEQDVKAGDFKQDFFTESGKIAIIDAALLDGIRNPLVSKAIVIPVLYDGATFMVQGKFDDSILRRLTIVPKEDIEGNVHKQSSSEGEDVVIKPKSEGRAHITPLSKGGDRAMTALADPAGASAEHTTTNLSRDGKSATPGRIPDPAKTIGRRKGHQSKAAQGRRSAKDGKKRRRSAIAKQTLSADVQQVHDFIIEAKLDVTAEDIRAVENKQLLSTIVNKIFYMGMDGWSLKEGVLKHKYGETTDANTWVIKEGKLYHTETGNRPNLNYDWAYNTRSAIQDFITEENKNLDVDSIVEGIRNAGRARTISG